MNRRGFIQITGTALLPILLGVFPKKSKKSSYTIKIVSASAFGHLVRKTSNVTPSKIIETDTVIVGGGVAGVSAAYSLGKSSFLLFEASDRIGGSSSSGSWKDTEFAMGAHYELAYPENFGAEVLQLLTELNIIYDGKNEKFYNWVDKKYLIKESEMEQCFTKQGIEDDVLGESDLKKEFEKLLEPFYNKMPLPTRLIDPSLHYLNELSFKEFLESKLNLTNEFENRISYQMLDDWGGKTSQVSALAGIHYYTCRPYNTKDVELFSPPNGNAYFVEKMLGRIPVPESLFCNTLVRSIEEFDDRVEAEVLFLDGHVEKVISKKLIYAGQKHSLPYILKNRSEKFEKNVYAPWIVLNFVCKEALDFDKWQNDLLTDELHFLGFVNSAKQHTRSEEYDVLSAYYCFEPDQRNELLDIEQNPDKIIEATFDLIYAYTKIDLREIVVHVNIHLMGHAMPIPVKNYLSLSDVPVHSDKIVFAGVDTGRLPLFFEACDSGIQAAQWVKQFKA